MSSMGMLEHFTVSHNSASVIPPKIHKQDESKKFTGFFYNGCIIYLFYCTELLERAGLLSYACKVSFRRKGDRAKLPATPCDECEKVEDYVIIGTLDELIF